MTPIHERPLIFLWHPGTREMFSGYGLPLASAHLVGLVMVDRPRVADPTWLAEIERVFGQYQLVPMTQGGARGMVCQMLIAQESRVHLRLIRHPLREEMREALLPLLEGPPAVTLRMTWDDQSRYWTSTIVRPPRFPLGQLLITRGAGEALEEAGQDPMEFMTRHQAGDWGELGDADTQENEVSLEQGFQLLSAYTLTTGVRIWLITEADRSATTVLLPEEY